MSANYSFHFPDGTVRGWIDMTYCESRLNVGELIAFEGEDAFWVVSSILNVFRREPKVEAGERLKMKARQVMLEVYEPEAGNLSGEAHPQTECEYVMSEQWSLELGGEKVTSAIMPDGCGFIENCIIDVGKNSEASFSLSDGKLVPRLRNCAIISRDEYKELMKSILRSSCAKCGGTGEYQIHVNEYSDCPACNGKGY